MLHFCFRIVEAELRLAQMIALFPSLAIRLSGIALASFSSGLGELTCLQLATRYGKEGAGKGVGWFSSGTGAAGLVGAAAWWIVRPLGVRDGLLSLSFLPFLFGTAYGIILPSVDSFHGVEGRGMYEQLHGDAPSPDEESADDAEEANDPSGNADVSFGVSATSSEFEQMRKDAEACDRLSFSDKLSLIKPMLFVYIIPLVLVYFFEYTINQGVAPTLLYPLPTRAQHPLLSLVIKQLKDYYPLYQLTYQTFVFLSRSSISVFRLPAIPKKYLWLPAILQGGLLLVLTSESLYQWFRESIASPLAIVLVCIEGLAGGSA